MIEIGPYRFTTTDARRTVSLFPAMWEQLAQGRNAASIEHLVPQFTGDGEADIAAAWHALRAAGSALRAAGALPSRTVGSVVRLSTSSGGVPKLPVDTVDVGFGGIVGDVQATREHHGRPWQALCLWSAEVIDQFRSEGHPLSAGSAGENITVAGLPWAEIRPGVRLLLGDVVADVSAYAVPCSKNARWFTGGDFELMHHNCGPISRVYATVVAPGRIAVGDAAILEP